MQHRHALDDAQRNVHVVLDDDEADVLRHRREDLDQLGPLRGRQAGGRLVEQDEARRAGQRQRDLELALLAVAQLADQAIAHVLSGARPRSGFRPTAAGASPVRGRISEKRPRETPRQAR